MARNDATIPRMQYKLFTDGGARGNPGPAGAGAVIFDSENNVVKDICRYLGEKTNNEAEYTGLLMGLKLAQTLKIDEIACFLDSELVVKQLNGEYKVKNARLKEFFDRVKAEEKSFKKITYAHVPRKENAHADALVNKAVDERIS